MSLQTVPFTPAQANRIVERLHRHHGALPLGYAQICIGAVSDGRLCGVSMTGRPTNRNNDDGQTMEVLRLATDGTRNASSFLLGASANAAKASGAWRILTYTLDSETGASLRAVGWIMEQSGIHSNWTIPYPGRIVIPRDHYEETKRRWVCYFRDSPIEIINSVITDPVKTDQITLFEQGLSA